MKIGGKKVAALKIGRLRRGQFITSFGCGAIVDLPRESVIIAGTDYWKHYDDDDYKINEDNLQQYLGVDYFVAPAPAEKPDGNETGYGIPAFRFPQWMYCPTCKRLAPARTFGFVGHPRCEKCTKKPALVPSRFVTACENGHLDEFPYVWWVHDGEQCERPELYISMSEKSSGLDSIVITCKTCGKQRSMAGSFGFPFKCTHRRPWLNDKEALTDCKPMRTMQRGATNLHFSVTTGALSIPPWSQKIQIELGKKWTNLECFMHNKADFITVVTGWGLPQRCSCSVDELWHQAQLKYEKRKANEQKSWQDILEEEYKAFISGSSDEEGQFKTRMAQVPEIAAGYVNRVVLALRLREVMALQGFKRVDLNYDVDDMQSFTRLSRDFMDWLPAVELLGEGIFIEIDQEKLAQWESRTNVIERYANWQENQPRYLMAKGPGLSPRYVLLHTLAHHLIRQLTLQCGYGSASIKERIYCTFQGRDTKLPMAGILLYTATNDSEGSLGGLVREGEADRLDNTIRHLLENASWCSADPLCIQSKGQGLDALNFAACHSCTLLPETSCEKRNCYLDRASLIGTLDNADIGFFSGLMTGDE